MLAAVTDWVKNIILVVLFASFLELLLPSSSMQRFIRVILGLTIMLAILNPAMEIIQDKWIPEQVPALSSAAGNAGRVLGAAENGARERDRMAVELYKKELARQVRAVVTAIDGVADARVAVTVADGQAGSRTAMLEKLTVYVQPGLTTEERKVPKVTIGTGPEKPQTELNQELRTKIARTVSELYQLRDNQLEIRKMN